MKISLFADINSAGMNALSTWFFKGFISFISKFALSFIELFKIANAVPMTKFGIDECFLHKSSANYLKDEKALSRTSPAIEGSLSACIRLVTAPMLLPHKPIVLTVSDFLRWSTTHSISSLSCHPKLMNSPSLNPHPLY